MSGRVPTVVEIADTPIDQLPPLIHVPPLTKPFDVAIRPPGSKSLTNRALLLAALAEGTSTLKHALVDADDAQVMLRAIQQLGAKVDQPDADTLKITGVAGRWKIPAGQTVTLNLNNAGTATRFLTAAAILAPPESGGIIIDGNARMRERPIGELVDAMRSIGASCEYVVREGYPPLCVRPFIVVGQKAHAKFGRTQSSQFVSALLLTGPFLSDGLLVEIPALATSAEYIAMSASLLGLLKATVRRTPDKDSPFTDRVQYDVVGSGLGAFQYQVEPDASGAANFFAAAAIVRKSSVLVSSLCAGGEASLQGDAKFAPCLRDVQGAELQTCAEGIRLTGGVPPLPFIVGLSDMPDTAMAAAAVACFGSGTAELGGLRTLRVKETDRIAALVTELAKVRVTADPIDNGFDEALRITPPPGGIDCSPNAPRVEFDTYDDHRMAMSLALIGLRRPNVYIRDPACVRKTYPTYWRDLAKLYQ